MAYTFNPTPAQANLLAQIAQRESSGNPFAVNPDSGASGLYQFKDSTWQWVASKTGVGTQYASAAAAPVSDQNTNALWLLQNYGPNATISWAASGPYDTTGLTSSDGALVDLSGTGASVSTASIMDSVSSTLTSMGLDPASPEAGLAVALGLGVLGLVVMAVVER